MYSDINYLKEFVYDTKLKEFGVFSKQYFSSILYSIYKDSSEDNLFCFTFGDFNKLNQINKKHSFKTGDSALKSSLELMRKHLPPDTIIARIAGDEFCFLTPNAHKKDMDKIFSSINESLIANRENNYGLTITTSSLDSSLYGSFDDMHALTELDVTRQKKLNHKKQFKNKEELLTDSIYNGLSNYFAYYRLESKTLPKQYFATLKSSIINLMIHNLETPDESMLLNMELLKSSSGEADLEFNHLEIEPQLATAFHNSITSNADLPPESNNEFNKLFKFLITDPLTGQVSKKFFDMAILPIFKDSKTDPVSIRLFDLTHLKLSNDIIGHNKTDEKISELYKNLVSQIQAENSTAKYLSSAGNCGLLLIENATSTIPENKINEFLKVSLASQRILSLTTTSKTCAPSEISETITQLESEAKRVKEEQKLQKISQKGTIIPLQLALGDSINLYKKITDNPYLMKNKQAFVIKIFETLNQVLQEQFPEQSQNPFYDEK